MISAWRATGSRVSVTEVEVEYWYLDTIEEAGLAVAAKGIRKACLTMMEADIMLV